MDGIGQKKGKSGKRRKQEDVLDTVLLQREKKPGQLLFFPVLFFSRLLVLNALGRLTQRAAAGPVPVQPTTDGPQLCCDPLHKFTRRCENGLPLICEFFR